MHRAIRKEKPAGALIAISTARVSERTTYTLMTGCDESHNAGGHPAMCGGRQQLRRDPPNPADSAYRFGHLFD
jgi:hypothetical protein